MADPLTFAVLNPTTGRYDNEQLVSAENPLPVTGGGGGGGGGDASAANQTTQITAANLTNTRLSSIITNLGSPFQAGGAISNTAFGISGSLPAGANAIGSITNTTFASTQSGTWNITNISGTITLPTGAATAANQITIIGHVDGIETAIGSTNTLLTASNVSTGSIDTKMSTLIGHVDGIETLITATNAKLDAQNGLNEYETVAASQTAQTLGATGATGDELISLLVVPTTTSPGVVTILDNATSINVFAGGASSLSNLVPFTIYLGMKSVSGAWKVTTGAGLSVIATGNFT